ncbi:MAG: TldD/PmbA family protein [Candidatus Thorarchaeota archaeon]|nr:TldD/PmbA family protein [Candidatus Thorarchaeota archaeon]
MEQLLDVAELATKKALEFGADQVEVYVASSRSFSIEVENNSIKSATEKRDAGIGIRSVVDKKIGFAYVTTQLKDDYEEAAAKSVKLARASIPDPDFVSLPSFSGAYPRVNGLYDHAVAELSSEGAADLIVRATDTAIEAIGNMQVAVESQLTAASGFKAIVNSLGISQSAKSTSVMMYAYPAIKKDDDQTASFEYQVSRFLKDIDPEWIGTNASKKTLQNLGGKTIEGGDLPVILAPLAVGTLLGGGFAGAVNAEEVQYGRSYVSDDFGSKIASDELTIIDDGLFEGGTGSRAFDAEGYPSQRTEILENGILKGLLHNSYTANKDEVDNTGNASRPSYAGIPSISTSNFTISPDKGNLDDLVGEIDHGILCANTGDRPNMTTGDLSAMVMEGFYIESGEIKHPVKNTLIGINMRDLLSRIHRIGDDVRTTFSIVSPSLVIESAKITSG